VADGKPSLVDVSDLGRLLLRRRRAHEWSLRDVADQLGGAMTASSLSRIERGAIPDSKNVPILAKWLELPLDRIGWPGEAHSEEDLATPDVVEVHLRADRNLEPAAAEVLSTMFRHLYESVASGTFTVSGQEPKSKD
jgi:transcriptional regulator with XRE-family HTH domain